MKDWTPDKRYTDMYFARADNEQEYIQLIKNLFLEQDVTHSFSADQWTEKESLFDNDRQLWHDYFDTECMYDDKYEDEELPLPQNYYGEIKEKPEKSEYPVVVYFENIGEKYLTWYSIN